MAQSVTYGKYALIGIEWHLLKDGKSKKTSKRVVCKLKPEGHVGVNRIGRRKFSTRGTSLHEGTEERVHGAFDNMKEVEGRNIGQS